MIIYIFSKKMDGEKKVEDIKLSVWLLIKIISWSVAVITVWFWIINAYNVVVNKQQIQQQELDQAKKDIVRVEKKVDSLDQIRQDVSQIKVDIEWIKKNLK